MTFPHPDQFKGYAHAHSSLVIVTWLHIQPQRRLEIFFILGGTLSTHMKREEWIFGDKCLFCHNCNKESFVVNS